MSSYILLQEDCNLYRALYKNEIPPRNELFFPKRMAYAVDLEDGNFDIPSTIIRNKADCPSFENTATLTMNDLVINTVIHIFSNLRLDKRELQEKGELKDDKPKEKAADADERMMESADAIDDSDEEGDNTKMDQGSKKGPVERWGFDMQEEYSSYMSRREALPKAALQYGRKMSDGRKSRRVGPRLDRELKQSHRVTEKLKAGDSRKHKY
ncbi:hypothetical protein C0Q70_06278 [Pomacea canaliculata]|uniref:RED-like N-terminal domain-containing protein n=1 Tax=Pomacea canaliculata TaxID=400727 RepID=A0A2T7PNQ3_POMCA|nr:hypothetical protein C0Q70_06278 [Pomacea canaliculata]